MSNFSQKIHPSQERESVEADFQVCHALPSPSKEKRWDSIEPFLQ